MKKHLSVWMLHARSTLYKALLVSLAAVAVQVMLFAQELKSMELPAQAGLESVFSQAYTAPVAALAFVLLLVALVYGAGYDRQRTDLVIRRLRISESAFALWQALHIECCLLLFWALQVAVALACSMGYLQRWDPAGTQTLFLAFWRQPWLHAILPVMAPLRWVRNLLLLAALALAAAAHARLRWNGRRGWLLPVLATATVVLFTEDPAEATQSVLLLIFCVCAVWRALSLLLQKEVTDDEADA